MHQMLSGNLSFDPSPSTASHRILGMSDKRKVLIFYPPATDTITINCNTPVVANKGIILMPGCTPAMIHHETHGELVTRDWYAIGTNGADPLVWTESLSCECKALGHE